MASDGTSPPIIWQQMLKTAMLIVPVALPGDIFPFFNQLNTIANERDERSRAIYFPESSYYL